MYTGIHLCIYIHACVHAHVRVVCVWFCMLSHFSHGLPCHHFTISAWGLASLSVFLLCPDFAVLLRSCLPLAFSLCPVYTASLLTRSIFALGLVSTAAWDCPQRQGTQGWEGTVTYDTAFLRLLRMGFMYSFLKFEAFLGGLVYYLVQILASI